MRIGLAQYDIAWENKTANFQKTIDLLKQMEGKTDLAVFPEMFSTGFSMNSHLLAETMDGETMHLLQQWSQQFNLALAGCFICKENEAFFNRAFFITPEGDTYYYDKRHLFRMGNEPESFSPGNKRCILHYKGWNICLAVCYDLRFPVWLRNTENAYDLLILVANWPSSRNAVWDTLLQARAIENQSYVCGVNRTGTDGAGLHYSGHSAMIDAKGKRQAAFQEDEEGFRIADIHLEDLVHFREKFPAWKDADPFTIP